jgi:hypothetical protein
VFWEHKENRDKRNKRAKTTVISRQEKHERSKSKRVPEIKDESRSSKTGFSLTFQERKLCNRNSA